MGNKVGNDWKLELEEWIACVNLYDNISLTFTKKYHDRFCKDTFDKNYKATIGVDFEMERFEVLGVPFSLQLWVSQIVCVCKLINELITSDS